MEKHRLKVVIAGAGAGFALEDVYVLGQALKWAHENGLDIAAALDLVDRVRSPHYKKLVSLPPFQSQYYSFMYKVLVKDSTTSSTNSPPQTPISDRTALRFRSMRQWPSLRGRRGVNDIIGFIIMM